MEKKQIKIGGMFCPNCEQRIAKALSDLDGVKNARVSYRSGMAELEYDSGTVTDAIIKQAVEDAGYKIIDRKGFPVQSIYILTIIAALYVILDRFGVIDLFRIYPDINVEVHSGMLFVIGLLTSVHCIAMCGGINLLQSTHTAQTGSVLLPNLLYNLGRVVSYTIIGGIVGAIGSAISLGGHLRGIVAIAAGLFMILMGMNMLGLFRVLRIHMPVKTAVALGKFRRGQSSFVVGLLNGLMPCGPLQSMQLYALYTGSFVGGALSMFLFSMGTVPLLLLFGIISGKLNKKFASSLLAVSAALVVILGIGMVGNGLNLSGASWSIITVQQGKTAVIVEEYQEVTTEVDYGSYEPITIKAGIPLRWTIVVPEGKLNGCNNEMIIPEYNIDVKLHEGENLVEFIPEASKTIPYTCWMGMIRSTIKITE